MSLQKIFALFILSLFSKFIFIFWVFYNKDVLFLQYKKSQAFKNQKLTNKIPSSGLDYVGANILHPAPPTECRNNAWTKCPCSYLWAQNSVWGRQSGSEDRNSSTTGLVVSFLYFFWYPLAWAPGSLKSRSGNQDAVKAPREVLFFWLTLRGSTEKPHFSSSPPIASIFLFQTNSGCRSNHKHLKYWGGKTFSPKELGVQGARWTPWPFSVSVLLMPSPRCGKCLAE